MSGRRRYPCTIITVTTCNNRERRASYWLGTGFFWIFSEFFGCFGHFPFWKMDIWVIKLQTLRETHSNFRFSFLKFFTFLFGELSVHVSCQDGEYTLIYTMNEWIYRYILQETGDNRVCDLHSPQCRSWSYTGKASLPFCSTVNVSWGCYVWWLFENAISYPHSALRTPHPTHHTPHFTPRTP